MAGRARRRAPLPPGSLIQRVCQIVEIGDFGIANVHLSHGQRLNRRQLRGIALPAAPRAAVLGDFNLVGPASAAVSATSARAAPPT